MYVVIVRDAHGNTTVYGSFLTEVVAEGWASAQRSRSQGVELAVFPIAGDGSTPNFMELQPVIDYKAPHPTIVAEARRQAKADACTAPFFLKGRCTSCGTSPARHFTERKRQLHNEKGVNE